MSVSSRAAFALLIQITELGFLKDVIGLLSIRCVLPGSPGLKSSNIGSRIENFWFLCLILCFCGIVAVG